MTRTDADASTAGSESRRSSRSGRGWRAVRTLAVAVAIGTALVAVAFGSAGAAPTGTGSSDGDAATDPALVVEDATLEVDETEPLRVSLSNAPDGVAGFRLTLAVEGGDAATIENASYPDRYGLTTPPAVSDDGERITVEAADLGDEVTAGATDVTLASIDVTGADDGETTLRVTDLQVDADGGGSVEPSLEAGAVTVGVGTDGPSGAESSGSAGSNESESPATGSNDSTSASETDEGSDDDSMPGFAIGTAVAVLAACAAALIERSS